MSEPLSQSAPGPIGMTAKELAAWDQEEPRPIFIYSWGMQFGDPQANIEAYLAEHPEEAE